MKYKAKITVDYEFDVEDLIGITQEDVYGYKAGFQDSYFEGREDIETVEHMILAELENAIYSNMPRVTPFTYKALKIKGDMETVEMEIEKV